LRAFVASEKPLMFATDVAARGLDIKGVSHVVNFDMVRDERRGSFRVGNDVGMVFLREVQNNNQSVQYF
jgi:superfamily II DNA/RNA helicase